MAIMDANEVANATRGWIMCFVSGIACCAGASIICVDAMVRLIPGQKHFRIQESNAFLACSLSLSFGVMMFSALYNMLPESKRYFIKAEFEDDTAGLIMMGCFVGGFIGIQVLSRLLHQLMPSHVVDCDHSHSSDGHLHLDDGHSEHGHGHSHGHSHGIKRLSGLSRRWSNKGRPPTAGDDGDHAPKPNGIYQQNCEATESTPLLPTETERGQGTEMENAHRHNGHLVHAHTQPHSVGGKRDDRPTVPARRASMQMVRSRVMSFVKDTKSDCDSMGNCFGFTDPCGQDCFKHMSSRSALSRTASTARTSGATANTSGGSTFFPASILFPGVVDEDDGNGTTNSGPRSPRHRPSPRRMDSREHVGPIGETVAQLRNQHHDHEDAHAHAHADHDDHHDHTAHAHAHTHGHDHGHDHHVVIHGAADPEHDHDHDHDHDDPDLDVDLEAQHHHHVPANAFLSIGLQTVVAIALHKFPEGFITYATNMASPALGFNVFMALFVHNIAEGFSMALPLYMALGSKLKAVAWSSLLGGLSQPAGAAVAWLWFRLASRGSSAHYVPDHLAYGALFAVTAGIMTSVALQLFVESLSLNHSRNLSIAFAFVGMVLLGVSSSLVEDD